MLRNIVVTSILTAALAITTSIYASNFTFAQSEQNFTSPKWGVSMQYPADWTFVENLYEDRDYRPNDPTAYLGTFCPTASLEDVLGNTQCATVPATVKIKTYKLEEGTTSKEFHDNEISPRLDSEFLKANYARKNIETSDIKISGLPAIQRIDTSGGGKMDKLLQSIGGEGLPKSKFLGVYVANGNIGYEVAFDVSEKDFETYSPIFQKMIDSIQIQGTE